MDLISNVIAGLALLVSVLTALYTRSESNKRHAERVDDHVRAILVDNMRPLDYGLNSARITIDFDDPPEIFQHYDTSGLRQLAPRLRRSEDRAATKSIAEAIDLVGAVWTMTKSCYDRWTALTPAAYGSTDERAALAEYESARDSFLQQGEALQEGMQALINRIDARYR